MEWRLLKIDYITDLLTPYDPECGLRSSGWGMLMIPRPRLKPEQAEPLESGSPNSGGNQAGKLFHILNLSKKKALLSFLLNGLFICVYLFWLRVKIHTLLVIIIVSILLLLIIHLAIARVFMSL